jgi:hypothetical protein
MNLIFYPIFELNYGYKKKQKQTKQNTL